MKVDGEMIFCGALTVTNELGEVRVLAFVATKSHAQFESALVKMRESLAMYGHSPPQVFYTDNVAADKNFLETIYPSLTNNVIPVEKYSNLLPFTVPSDVDIRPHSSSTAIADAIAKITVDLDPDNETLKLVTHVDSEWNVILGGVPQPTAILQVAYKKWINIFQVGISCCQC